MRGRLRCGLLATACAAALLIPAGPSQAVAGFAPTQSLPSAGMRCAAEAVAAADGTVRGWASCDTGDASRPRDGLAYVERGAGRWTTTPVGGFAGRVLDAAHDTTGTYLLLSSTGGPTGLGPAIVKRAPDGRITGRRIGPGEAPAGTGSLVARDGRWWAVFAVAGTGRDGDRSFNLYEAGTLLGNTQARPVTDTVESDFFPSLVLRPQGGLVLLWQRSRDMGDRRPTDVRVAVTTGRGWTSRSLAVLPDPTSSDAATDGRYVYVSWIQDGQPIVGSDESGIVRTRRFPTRPCASQGRLAASSGALHYVFSQCVDSDGGYAVTALERRAGSWTSARLYSDRQRQEGVTDLVSAGGRATVLLTRYPDFASTSRTQ